MSDNERVKTVHSNSYPLARRGLTINPHNSRRHSTSVVENIKPVQTNGWTQELETILLDWKKDILIRKNLHILKLRFFKRAHWGLSIPTSVIGAVVGAGLVSLVTTDSCGNAVDISVKITLGVLSVIGSILNGMVIALDFKSISQQNKDAVDAYDSLERIIDTTIRLPMHMRGEAVATIQSIRELYDRCIEQSPEINVPINIAGIPAFPIPKDVLPSEIEVSVESRNSRRSHDHKRKRTFGEVLGTIKRIDEEKESTDFNIKSNLSALQFEMNRFNTLAEEK